MVLMVLLAEVMKIKTLTAGNSLKNNTGFTLIELLVVVVIVICINLELKTKCLHLTLTHLQSHRLIIQLHISLH
jgi:hypothetical protein